MACTNNFRKRFKTFNPAKKVKLHEVAKCKEYMVLFILHNHLLWIKGIFWGEFFCPFSFPRIIYVHSLESARAKGQQQPQQQQQLQASFSFTSVKMLPTCRSGAAAWKTTGGEDKSITTGLETDSPSVRRPPGRWKQFGSSQWEELPPVWRPLEFIAGSTRVMFSSSPQHLEHLAAWLSSDLQLLSHFLMHGQSFLLWLLLLLLLFCVHISRLWEEPPSLDPEAAERFPAGHRWELVTPQPVRCHLSWETKIQTPPSFPEQPGSAWNLWLIGGPPGGITPDTDTLMQFPLATAPNGQVIPEGSLWEICLRQEEVKTCFSAFGGSVKGSPKANLQVKQPCKRHWWNSYHPAYLNLTVVLCPTSNNIDTCWTRGVWWHYIMLQNCCSWAFSLAAQAEYRWRFKTIAAPGAKERATQVWCERHSTQKHNQQRPTTTLAKARLASLVRLIFYFANSFALSQHEFRRVTSADKQMVKLDTVQLASRARTPTKGERWSPQVQKTWDRQ